MNIDHSTIQKIAHLSRLQIDPAQEEAYLKDLNAILAWVDQLKTIDTTGVEPLIHLNDAVNVLREDIPQAPLPHATALNLAPQKNSDYYLVPKVMDQPGE
jgi:aspartyl-tRNA(Asn)/glutamyl-tRNA(Gln) amidotransferase subunit C